MIKTSLFLLTLAAANAMAQPASNMASSTSLASRSQQPTTVTQSAPQQTAAQTSDQIARQVWGLSAEELERAKLLLKGPRAHFSVPNLSPVEALGIHARSDAERRRYAEKFAKAQHDDTERVLAWAVAYQAAFQRLYPNDKVIDFAGLQATGVSPGMADAALVPRQSARPGKRAGGGAP
jgi:hypothetical protein